MCDHYQLLLEGMDPDQVSKTMHFKNLLSSSDLDILEFCFPINYMKNCLLLEYIRNLQIAKLFTIAEALCKIDNQKHIFETLLKGIKLFAV